MGMMIEFARPDGRSCPGYLAGPTADDGAPGLVVLQEWWGLNRQIRGLCDRFAEAGLRVLAPDLFRGRTPEDEREAGHLMDGLDFADAADQDVRGAVQYLKATGSQKAAVSGFCMGGALTVLAAARVPEADAAVCFYGLPPDEAWDPAQVTKPLLMHFANVDDWVTPQWVDALEGRLREAGVPHELHRYDAQHGFVNETRPRYSPEAAQVAWDRTLDFLKRTLR